MTRPTIRIHNMKTNEVIDREMNDEEFLQYELDEAAQSAIKNDIEAKEAQKQLLLDRLGITADEAKLLLG